MKINSQKLLPGSSKSLSLIAVRGNKVTALSDTKKIIKFDNFISNVESAKKTKKRKVSVGPQFKTLKIELLKIEKILKKQLQNDKNYAEKSRRRIEKRKRRETETRLEKPKLGKRGGELAKKLTSNSIFDAIRNFIGNILLGKFVLFLLDNYDKIVNFIKYISPVTNFLGSLTKNIFGGIVSLVQGVFGVEDAIRAEIKAIGGDGAGKEYDKFTNALKRYLNLAIILTMAGIPTSIPVGGQKPGRGPLDRGIKKPPKGAPRSRSSSIRKYLSRNKRVKFIEKKYGNSAAKIFENALKNGKSTQGAQAAVDKAIRSGKITPKAAGPGLRGGRGATRGGVFKRGLGKSVSRIQTKTLGRGVRLGLNRFATKAASRFLGKIPILGPLIIGIDTYLQTGKLDKALFKSGGAALGGFLGSFIPIPVLGTLLGTFVGEYVGDLFYILLRGGGPEALGKKLKGDIQKVIDGATLVKNWIFKGIKNIQNMKGPEFLGLKLGGWATLLNPFDLNLYKKYNILRKAFFSETPIPKEKTTRTSGAGSGRGGAGSGRGGAGEVSRLGSGNLKLRNLTDQDFSDLAYAVSGEAQGGTDDEFGVAANILTRVADPGYPNTIMGVFTARGQYAAYSDGGARRDSQLAERLKANKEKIAEAIRILNGRTDFKGTAEYGNMGPGDVKFSSRGNFYHYASQRGKNDPPPANPPQHWKKLVSASPQQNKPQNKTQNKTVLEKFLGTTKSGSEEQLNLTGVGSYTRGSNIFGNPVDKLFLYKGAPEFDTNEGEIRGKNRIEKYLRRYFPHMLDSSIPAPKTKASTKGPSLASAGDILPASSQTNLNSDILRTKASYEEGTATLIAIQPVIVEKESQADLFNKNLTPPTFT